MKKRHYISIAIVLSGLAVCVGFYLNPRQLSPEECGDVYRRYRGADGIEVSFLQNFRVNDTVAVAVTTLHAETDSAWAALIKDFGISPTPPEVLAYLGMDTNSTIFKRVSVTDYTVLPREAESKYYLFVEQEFKHTISLFLIENDIQRKMIINDKLSEITKIKNALK